MGQYSGMGGSVLIGTGGLVGPDYAVKLEHNR